MSNFQLQKRKLNLTFSAFIFFVIILNLAIFATDSIATQTDNLIQNPGAENGTSYWMGSALAYYSQVGADDGDKVTPRTGNYFFAYNGDIDNASASQTINVSQYKGFINGARFSGYLQGWFEQGDYGQLKMTFLDEESKNLGEAHVSDEVKGSPWQYTKIDVSDVPQETHFIKVEMYGKRKDGKLTVHYDDLSLTLDWEEVHLSGNLIQNPGAENGTSYWVGSELAYYSQVGGDDKNVIPRSGNYFFAYNADIDEGSASQTIDVSQYKGAIKNARLSGHLQGWFEQSDYGQLKMVFLNESKEAISQTYTTDKVKGSPWQYKQIKVSDVPDNTHFIKVEMYAAEPDYKLTVHYDDLNLVLELNLPHLSISTESLNFGNLYVSNRDGATEYNGNRTKEITLTNDGDDGTSADWAITNVPDGVTITTTLGSHSGSIYKGDTEKITVSVNPSSSGSFSKNFKINDTTISLSATVYDTPAVTISSNPAKGSNNKVNIAVNTSPDFNTTSVDFTASSSPNFPGATVQKYQWRVDDGSWESRGNTKSYDNSTAGTYTIKCRMVDSNNVISGESNSISICVWNLPEVTSGKGSRWYGSGNRFYGKIDDSISIQVDYQLNGNESISTYAWWRKSRASDSWSVTGEHGDTYSYSTSYPDVTNPQLVKCQVTTNYGIKSYEKSFMVRVYDKDLELEITNDSDASGRPNKEVWLKAIIPDCGSKYPGYSSTNYNWYFTGTPDLKRKIMM